MELELRGLPLVPPRYLSISHLDSVTQLVLAGHHNRAAEHIAEHAPHLRDTTATALASLTGLAHQKFSRLVGLLRDPNLKHKRKRYAMDVVRRASRLYEQMEEGHRPTLSDLEYVLGDFKT